MTARRHLPMQSEKSDSPPETNAVRDHGDEMLAGNAAMQELLAARMSANDPGDDTHPTGGLFEAKDGVRTTAPATKSEALSRHSANLTKMNRMIQSALSVEVDPVAGTQSRANLLRNSAEWIDQGQATLQVLTPTHDSHLRPSVSQDKTAFFDNRKNYRDAGATYDSTLTRGQALNNTGLTIQESSVLGSMTGDGLTLTVVDPTTKSEGLLVETLIHEVQHDADQHDTQEPWATTAPAADPNAIDVADSDMHNKYMSEFRAYWFEDPEGSSTDKKGSSSDTAVTNVNVMAVENGRSASVTTNFNNVRQQNIFLQLFNHRPAGDYWDPHGNGGGGGWTVLYGWMPHYYALDPNFKKMVDAYDRPTSGNLVNSVRIQALSDALGGQTWAQVDAAIKGLDALDLQAASDQSRSAALWEQAKANLSTAEYLAFSRLIGAPTSPSHEESVVVQRGDTLIGLAARFLNDQARWKEIYQLNQVEIGPDPGTISGGQKLKLPKS